MLNITVTGDRELIAKLGAMPNRVHQELVKKVTALRLQLEAKIKGDKLSGQVLNVVTGALRRSIFSATDDEGSAGVWGRAASAGDVKYAAIHEFGGKTSAHEIVPDKAKVLAFMVGGKQVFAARVHHPGSQMPERSFMRSSLGDMRVEIVDGLKEAVREGLRK